MENTLDVILRSAATKNHVLLSKRGRGAGSGKPNALRLALSPLQQRRDSSLRSELTGAKHNLHKSHG